MENAILAIALTAWPPYARIARAETLTVRGTDYVSAARISGASDLRILIGHIMPMCMPSLIVRVSLDMAGVILIAAGLGFLGLGVTPPQPEWGAMVSDGRNQILDQWWVCTFPGVAIFIVSLGFNLIGDGLRDVLDPHECCFHGARHRADPRGRKAQHPLQHAGRRGACGARCQLHDGAREAGDRR
jgi:peptide/nickel transport system permease protein